jgi:hypothetical protein
MIPRRFDYYAPSSLHGLQLWFRTPDLMMSTLAPLRENPHPTEAGAKGKVEVGLPR